MEIKDYNVMINGRNFFYQPIKNDLKTSDNTRNVYNRLKWWLQNRAFTSISLFQRYYKLIVIDLKKQQVLNANPEATQQINFIGNLDRAGAATMSMFSLLKK